MPDDMTHSLRERALTLLQPRRFHDPSELVGDFTVVPKVPGIYGWWFDNALGTVPYDDTLSSDGRHLLYVGICPDGSSPQSKRTLRDRMRDHCRGPISRSTLRRTLRALLAAELRLVKLEGSSRAALAGDGEARLSEWMHQHARVAWMPDAAPWLLESEVIKSFSLPLNIKGSAHPNAPILKAQRAAFRS